MNPSVLTVTQLNRLAREVLQKSFPLFWVSGEISNLTRAASGHIYFSLKDEAAQVRCVIFRNRAQLVPWRLENGQQVEAQALVTLYEARGDFQLTVEGLRRAGIGALYEAYARLLAQLEHEGLFAADRKQALPRFPRRIGIISSPQAAALSDIVTTMRRRAPHVEIVLYPALVQGDGAAATIATAIVQADKRSECEVLIIARGGGSIEDLWAFNEECVARAIAACALPIISGVGHETDTTIADFVADCRAPTPTAAAELVSAGWFAANHELAALRLSTQRALLGRIQTCMQRLDRLAHQMIHPGFRLSSNRQELTRLGSRLSAAMSHRLRREFLHLERSQGQFHKTYPKVAAASAALALVAQELGATAKRRLATESATLATLAAALKQLDPLATLRRGYSIVRDVNGQLVKSSRQLSAGDRIELHFSDGRAQGHIDEIG